MYTSNAWNCLIPILTQLGQDEEHAGAGEGITGGGLGRVRKSGGSSL